MVVRLCENVHAFYCHRCPVTVISAVVGAAPVVVLIGTLVTMSLQRLQASLYLSGVSGCSICDSTSPVGGMWIGKGNSYNHACTADVMPNLACHLLNIQEMFKSEMPLK